MTDICPTCAGARLEHDPTGLRVDHTNDCALRAAEDARHLADIEGARAFRYSRTATAAERTLLAAWGHQLPEGAVTTVSALTPGVLRRSWVGVDLDAVPTTTTTTTTTEAP
jgi:hypothetical protein